MFLHLSDYSAKIFPIFFFMYVSHPNNRSSWFKMDYMRNVILCLNKRYVIQLVNVFENISYPPPRYPPPPRHLPLLETMDIQSITCTMFSYQLF
jgi:hypothetical protein